MSRKSTVMRVGNAAIRVFVNLFVVIFTVVYLAFLLPIINFMGNELPAGYGGETDEPLGTPVVNGGDIMIDLGELEDIPTEIPSDWETAGPTETPTETPTATPEITGDPEHPTDIPEPTKTPRPTNTPIPTPVPTATPVPTPSPVPSPTPQWAADPIVEGVSKTNGSAIRLPEDAKNILILGYDKVADLTDTIIVASISEKTKSIQCLSLSRDAYVPYSGAVKDYLMKTGLHYSPGIYKLNCCYKIGRFTNYSGGRFNNSGIDFLCSILRSMMPNANMEIDDYIFVDTDGLAALIDLFGGANVYVAEDMYIPSGDRYVLRYKKGYHQMGGAEAVSFLRTRYRYNANGPVASTGDPYRKANQLRFVKDFASQVVTAENVARTSEILKTTSGFLFHSINSSAEISEYSRYALAYSRGEYKLTFAVVSGSGIDPLGDHASYVNLMK